MTGFWIGFFCSLYNHLAVNTNPTHTGFVDLSETYYKFTIKVLGRPCSRIISVAWTLVFLLELHKLRSSWVGETWRVALIDSTTESQIAFHFLHTCKVGMPWSSKKESVIVRKKLLTVLVKILPKVLLWYCMIWMYLFLSASYLEIFFILKRGSFIITHA